MGALPCPLLWQDGNLQLILYSAAAYWMLERATINVAALVWKEAFSRLNQRQRTEWVSKTVSLANALVVSTLSLIYLLSPTSHQPSTSPAPSSKHLLFSPSDFISPSHSRLFAFSNAEARILCLACGYFLWDVIDSWRNSTIAFVVHGAACLAVYGFSFTPFCAYYGPIFLLFELSTPFLNFRWWMDKMGWEKTHPQLMKINDILFASAFFGARIIWGTYQSTQFWGDMIAQYDRIPVHLFLIYGLSNVALNALNYHWFSKIVSRAMGSGGGKGDKRRKPLATMPAEANIGARPIGEKVNGGNGQRT